jgi:hypothetical protein
MIDDEFEICFEILLSVVLAKHHLQRVAVRAYLPVPYPRGRKKNNKKIQRCPRPAKRRGDRNPKY